MKYSALCLYCYISNKESGVTAFT